MRSSCRADHNIGAVDMIREVFERNRSSLEDLSHFDSALEGTIRHQNRGHAIALEMLGGEFSHLTGADDHHGLSCKVTENLACEFNGSIADRDRRLRDPRFRPYAFGHGKG